MCAICAWELEVAAPTGRTKKTHQSQMEVLGLILDQPFSNKKKNIQVIRLY